MIRPTHYVVETADFVWATFTEYEMYQFLQSTGGLRVSILDDFDRWWAMTLLSRNLHKAIYAIDANKFALTAPVTPRMRYADRQPPSMEIRTRW